MRPMKLDEVWKEIPNTSGFYFASSLGRVKSIDRIINYKTQTGTRPTRHKGVILRPIKDTTYLRVNICANGKTKLCHIHSLIATTFHGCRPRGKCCAHLNGNQHDNRAINLAWVTHKENTGHMKIHGTARLGERHPMSKLDDRKVIEIRNRWDAGEGRTPISKIFNITPEMVWRIGTRRNWAHLGEVK